VDVEARVAQGRFEHGAQVVLVVDEQQSFTGHATIVPGIPVNFL
jgi:hypothetical protein